MFQIGRNITEKVRLIRLDNFDFKHKPTGWGDDVILALLQSCEVYYKTIRFLLTLTIGRERRQKVFQRMHIEVPRYYNPYPWLSFWGRVFHAQFLRTRLNGLYVRVFNPFDV